MYLSLQPLLCHHALIRGAPSNSGTTGKGRDELPISALHSRLIISLLPYHRLLLREELSTGALSFHLVRFVMCG